MSESRPTTGTNDPLEPIPPASDALTAASAVLPVDTSGEVAAPIIVENTLWSSVNPQAYGGGRPSQITHLREHELEDKGDTGRWRTLDIIPTKADYILDLHPHSTACGRSRRGWPAARSR